MVAHTGNDRLAWRYRGIGRLCLFVICRREPARHGIDQETQPLLVGASPETLVQAGDRGTRPIGKRQQGSLSVRNSAFAHIDDVVAHCPLEGGLQFEPLPLALLVVCRDALCLLRGHVLDPVDVIRHARLHPEAHRRRDTGMRRR